MEKIGIFWLIVCVLLYGATGYVFYSTRSYIALVATLALSLLTPGAYVTFQCMANKVSEACVWGKSLISFYALFFALFVFPILFLLLSFFLNIFKKLRNKEHQVR